MTVTLIIIVTLQVAVLAVLYRIAMARRAQFEARVPRVTLHHFLHRHGLTGKTRSRRVKDAMARSKRNRMGLR